MTAFLHALGAGAVALVGDVPTLLFTLVRVAVVYAVLLGLLRLTGKRQLGQLTPFDLITLLLLSNVVQNAMIGPDNSLVGGLLGAGVLLGLNRGVSRVPWLRGRFEGHPVVLIYRGRLERDQLDREGVSEGELAEAVREHGLPDLAAVDTAVLEVDGHISIIPKDAASYHSIEGVASRRGARRRGA